LVPVYPGWERIKMNILVVDDKAQQIESMRMVLRSSGYFVTMLQWLKRIAEGQEK